MEPSKNQVCACLAEVLCYTYKTLCPSALFFKIKSPTSRTAYCERAATPDVLLSFSALPPPIFLVYTNTFLWRTSFNNSTTVIYTISASTPACRSAFSSTLHCFATSPHVGCTLLHVSFKGIVPIVLVALVPSAQNIVVLLGLAFGISAGMYWANRNYFTSLMTRSAHQFSFFTLEQVLATVASIIAPAAIGWLIVYGAHVGYQ